MVIAATGSSSKLNPRSRRRTDQADGTLNSAGTHKAGEPKNVHRSNTIRRDHEREQSFAHRISSAELNVPRLPHRIEGCNDGLGELSSEIGIGVRFRGDNSNCRRDADQAPYRCPFTSWLAHLARRSNLTRREPLIRKVSYGVDRSAVLTGPPASTVLAQYCGRNALAGNVSPMRASIL